MIFFDQVVYFEHLCGRTKELFISYLLYMWRKLAQLLLQYRGERRMVPNKLWNVCQTFFEYL